MEIIAKLGSLLGLSFISGINLYATVAVVGICTKYGFVQGIPPEFQVLANDGVIFVALMLYTLEFLVDKIPGLDTLWDSIHTLIRPLGGALLAVMQVGEASPALEVIAFMVGASLASAAHVTKAGTRLIVNSSPEPFSNMFISVVEDVGAVGLSYLSLAYPKISFFVTLGCLAVIAFVLPLTLRTVRMLFSALVFRVKCLGKGAACEAGRSLPLRFDLYFEDHKEPGEELIWSGPAYAAKVPGLSKFTPLQVVVTSKAIHVMYRRWFRMRNKVLPLAELRQQRSYPGLLLARWVLRTSRGDWLLHFHQPMYSTLPGSLTPGGVIHEQSAAIQ